MIDNKLQKAVSEALKNLYNIDTPAENVVLQKTKKEFSGDYTIVVFPFVKQARKSPEMVAGELGEAVKNMLEEVSDYNVIKGFLNFTVSDGYWTSYADSISTDTHLGMTAPNPNDAPVVIDRKSVV